MPSTTTINASDGTSTPLPLFAHLKYLFLHPLVVFEMSNLLGTGLDRDTLNICSQLLEEGANPEALAALVTELNKEIVRS